MGTLPPHDVRELRALVAKLKQTAADLDTLSKDLENICRIATETAANFKAVSSATPPVQRRRNEAAGSSVWRAEVSVIRQSVIAFARLLQRFGMVAGTTTRNLRVVKTRDWSSGRQVRSSFCAMPHGARSR